MEELRAKLKEAEQTIGDKTKEKSELQTDIASLAKTVEDVKQVLNIFGQALQNFERERKTIESFSLTKTSSIEAAIKNKKDVVKAKKEKVESDILKKGEEVNRQKEEADKVEAEYKNAKQKCDREKSALDSLKTSKQTMENKLKELKDLKGLIENEEKSKQLARAYFLITELNSVLEDAKSFTTTKEQFESALYDASNKLSLATKDLKKKEEDWKTAKNAFENKQKEWEGLRQNCRKIILDEISKV